MITEQVANPAMASTVLEIGEPAIPSYQPPVETSLSMHSNHPHYGCERRIGRRVNDCPETFAEPVQSWDCHVYFDAKSPTSERAALELRAEILETFPDVTVNRPYRDPIGPHPTSMWSCELHTPGQFAKLLPWLCTRRRDLSVLVHPNTGNPLADHRTNCYWLGKQLPLRLEIFR